MLICMCAFISMTIAEAVHAYMYTYILSVDVCMYTHAEALGNMMRRKRLEWLQQQRQPRMCIYIHVRRQPRMCIYIHVRMCMYVCMYVYTYVYICMYLSMYVCVCM